MIDNKRIHVLRDDASRLKYFQDLTGLTWEQIARLFGVSERLVKHWASGDTMPVVYRAHLDHLRSDLIKFAKTDLVNFMMEDREKTRERLFTVVDGKALYQRWLEEMQRPDSQRTWIDRQPQ